VLKNRRLTIHKVADIFKILFGSVQSIWGTANTCQVDAKFTPPSPTPSQRVRSTRDNVWTCVKVCKRGVEESQDFFPRWTQAMKHGCSAMTQKTGNTSD
jgi:hypothetical protein